MMTVSARELGCVRVSDQFRIASTIHNSFKSTVITAPHEFSAKSLLSQQHCCLLVFRKIKDPSSL